MIPGVVLLAMSVAGCSRSPEPGPRLLAELPPTYTRRTTVVSTDGNRYAYVETIAGAGQRVLANGFSGPFHPRAGWVKFAPKTNHLFYWVLEPGERRDKVVLYAPSGRIETDFTRPAQLAFSADGSRWGAFGPVEEPVPEGERSGDADATRLRAAILIDGVEVGRWAKANLPAFSPDGTHAAYVFEDDAGRGALVVDGETKRDIVPLENVCAAAVVMTGGGDVLSTSSVRYLSDGRLLAVTRERDGLFVRRDDEQLATYPRTALEGSSGVVAPLDPKCSERSALAPRWFRLATDAPVAAWWERPEGEHDRWRVVVDGKPVDDVLCDAPWEEEPPQPTADGRAVAYACVHRNPPGPGEVTVVTPRGRYGPYAGIWGICFSDDGERVAWGASNGKLERAWSIVVDGEPLVEGFRAVFRPRFTPDGKRVVWEGQRANNGRGVLGIDHRRFGNFEELHWGPDFPSSDRVAWVLRRDHRLVRLIEELE